MKMKWGLFLLPAAVLLASLACGGAAGGAGAASSGFSFSAGGAATDWRLVQDSASTSTHLVLDLLAPTGTSGQGITLILTTDPTEATWGYVSGTSYATQGVYTSPVVSIASAKGALLRILVGQGGGTAVSYGSTPVIQVALDLASGASAGAVTLTATQAGHLGTSATPSSITVNPGSLTVL